MGSFPRWSKGEAASGGSHCPCHRPLADLWACCSAAMLYGKRNHHRLPCCTHPLLPQCPGRPTAARPASVPSLTRCPQPRMPSSFL